MVESDNSLTVPPSVPILGGAKITGAATILAIMVAGAVWWVYDQNKLRNHQFDTLSCKLDLDMYIHSFPKGQIDWSTLPPDMYVCFPNFKVK